MAGMTRRELLAWMTAGTAGAVAGVSWLGDGSDDVRAGGGSVTPASSAPVASTMPAVAARAESAQPERIGRVVPAAVGDRFLVVVEMPGGNDGLSMVVPYGDGAYYDARPTVAIAERDVLALDDRLGLHPALERVANRGVAAVVGVGAAEPDGSHFEMMQRWWRGDPVPAVDGLGWVGRLADVFDGGSAVAAALTVGTGSHPILRAERASTLAIPGANAAWYLAGGENPIEAAFQSGVRAIGAAGGDGYYARITATAGRTVSLAERLVGFEEEDQTAYPESQLGRSLLFARRLFQLDGGPRVVHVVMDGNFDTHEGHGWQHEENMTAFDAAVGAFWDDLDASGLSDRAVLMTTSEFGRTVHENGSAGLDHGSASAMLVMGPVAPGVVGEHPSLTVIDDNDDLIASAPFDAYLGAVVEGWLGVPAAEVFPGVGDLLPLQFG
jgi:uncharacterized protein (DUF1501 family)